MKRIISTLVLAGLFLAPWAFSQPLNPTRGNNLRNAVRTRIVVVDATGRAGDFRKISDALAYVAKRPDRGGFTRYLVLIHPGISDGLPGSTGANYTEATLAIPTFTIVQGLASPTNPGNSFPGVPVVNLTGTSGDLVTMGSNSTLVNLDLKMQGNVLTGNTSMVKVGAVSWMTNVGLKAVSVVEGGFSLDMLSAAAGFVGWNVSTWRSGSAAGTRNVLVSGSGSAVLYGGRHLPGTSQAKLMEITGGTMQLRGVFLTAGATTDLVQTGGTLSTHFGTEYTTASGTITDPPIRAGSIIFANGPKEVVGAGAPEGAVTAPVGSTYRRTDGGAGTAFCVKESGTGNTGWVCK